MPTPYARSAGQRVAKVRALLQVQPQQQLLPRVARLIDWMWQLAQQQLLLQLWLPLLKLRHCHSDW